MKREKPVLNGDKNFRDILEEFKIFANNLIPINPEQAEWICYEIERILKENPNLEVKLRELRKSDEDWFTRQLTRTRIKAKERKEKTGNKRRRSSYGSIKNIM
ncbi:MAG: hypothetical protein QXJ19_00150 [Candidatus Bathyarchaeia archaeon]|nr:hypothetical protein [Candidatus Bathyarchaeota archaeon]